MRYHTGNIFFDEIRKLIAQGKTEDAILYFVDKLGASNEITLISNRFYQLKTKLNKGIISNEEEKRELNIINDSILNLLQDNSLEDDINLGYDFESNIHSRSTISLKEPLLLISGLVILGGLVIFIVFSFFKKMEGYQPQTNRTVPQEDVIIDKDDEEDCVNIILEEKHSILWDCLNKMMEEKKLIEAKNLLNQARVKTSYNEKIDAINSKLNDIEIMEMYDLDYAEGYFRDNLIISSINGKKGLIHKNGQVILDPVFESVNPQSFYPMIEVVKFDKIGFVDTTGEFIHYPKFDNANPQEFYPLVSVSFKNKIGFLNSKGDLIIKPVFDSVQYQSDGMIGVLRDFKWGFIDTLGNLKIDHIYSDIDYFEGGMTRVRKNQNEYVIDKEGKILNE